MTSKLIYNSGKVIRLAEGRKCLRGLQSPFGTGFLYKLPSIAPDGES